MTKGIPKPPKGDSFKTKIISLRLSQPDLTYAQIAEKLDCKLTTVRNACWAYGVLKNPRTRNLKAEYFSLRGEKPGLSVQEYAAELNCRPSSIYNIHRRIDSHHIGLIALGRAAHQAGFTLDQLKQLGAQHGA